MFHTKILWYSFILHISLLLYVRSQGSDITGYFQWSTETDEILYCPDDCKQADEELDECCSCQSNPCWNLNNINTSAVCGLTISPLHFEVTGPLGKGLIFNIIKTDLYEFIYTDTDVTKIPDNICDFSDSLVKLDLSSNKLVDASSVKCLTELDTLHLDNNLIASVDNTTFSNMTKLRVLTMRYNKLEHIPPNLVKTGARNIFTVDFSHNFVDTVDVTNIFKEGPFCVTNVSYTSAHALVNELNFRINQSVMHGPGDILLEHSHIAHFPNFTAVGVDYKDMQNCFKGKFSLDESSIRCDCNLYPYFTTLGKEAGRYWPNVFGESFICTSPEHMIGEDVTSVLEQQQFYKLTCDLENCPYSGLCHCIDNPDAKRITVNCTNAGLEDFPDEMPVGFWGNKNIELILVGNNIEEIPDLYYIDRLVGLDLQKNYIYKTNPTALKNLKCPVNMADQQLMELSPEFGLKDPTMFEFGDHPVKCGCDNLWIGEWIRVEKAYRRLNCKLDDGRVIWAEDVISDLLQCEPDIISWVIVTVPSIILITLIVIVAVVLWLFRYDVKIALRRWSRNKVPQNIEYDVFISFCEQDSETFFFVKNHLSPPLEAANYKIFTPWFEVTTGERDVEVLKAIERSRDYVVVLSKEYLNEYNAMFEFDCIWKNFHRDKSTKLILVNFDFLESKDINDPRINAFRRVKADISFRDRNDTLMERLIRRLGEPQVGRRKERRYRQQYNQHFNYNNTRNRNLNSNQYNRDLYAFRDHTTSV